MSRVKVRYVKPGGQGFHRHGGLAEKARALGEGRWVLTPLRHSTTIRDSGVYQR